jgi:ribosome biogenesis GTPase / thiamine phosphate phosphatase
VVGSSGVGKSTLVNTLTGDGHIATQGIREDDDKGRHTTTGRAMHRLPAGGWLVDTPGMRELQLTDVKSGLDEVFADVVAVAQGCRFSDCQHQAEPGCAIQAAIAAGELEVDRVKRWRKLAAEEAYNSESLAERRARSRAFSKMARKAMNDKRARRGE